MKLYIAGANKGDDETVRRIAPGGGFPYGEERPLAEAIAPHSRARLLISYFYIGIADQQSPIYDLARELGIPMFLDSGAFSADSRGEPVVNEDYIAFCQEHGSEFEAIAALDVIGDQKASYQNYRALRDAGVSCVPAFHPNEPWSALERLVEETDYVALGGMVPHLKGGARSSLVRWLARCFHVCRDVRVHGFGVNARTLLAMFPWYSVDSTTWLVGTRYGSISVRNYDGSYEKVRRGGKMNRATILHADKIPQRTQTPEERAATNVHAIELLWKWLDDHERMQERRAARCT